MREERIRVFVSGLNADAEWWDTETGPKLEALVEELFDEGVPFENVKHIVEALVATMRREHETMTRRVREALTMYGWTK